jgi:hypothetical protein
MVRILRHHSMLSERTLLALSYKLPLQESSSAIDATLGQLHTI